MFSLLLSTLFIAILSVGAEAEDGAPSLDALPPGSERVGPTYQFKYVVHDINTQDYKTHEEVKENGLVHGTYTVKEPSGDLRVVSYTAGDEKGFQAMVRVRHSAKPGSEAEQSAAQPLYGQSDVNKGRDGPPDEPFKIQLNTEHQDIKRTSAPKKHDSEEILRRASTRNIAPRQEISKENFVLYSPKKSQIKSSATANKVYTKKSVTSCL